MALAFYNSRRLERMSLLSTFRPTGFAKPVVLGLLALIFAFVASAGYAWYRYKNTPLSLPQKPLDFKLNRGSGAKQLAGILNQKGVEVSGTLLWIMSRFRGDGNQLKAGTYRLTEALTMEQLLDKVVKGDVFQAEIRFIEGWTFAQMRREINKNPELRHETTDLSEAELLRRIGATERSVEGLFFPSTYLFSPGSSDIDLFKQAYALMNKTLSVAWEKRAAELPYKTPYDLLTMASIVEKETGRESDRDKVAAVFINRLKIGMMLQSDPTTIYGMGDAYKGNIRRKDLQTDTPYNTYTRGGLTPTPISLPGKASIMAAINPAPINALYFVARGDGTSEFTSNLGDHNRAVSKYQLGK